MKRRRLDSVWVLACVLVALSMGSGASEVAAQGPNRVGLVVHLGGGNVLTRCVEFSEAELSGYEVLERAELQVARRAEGLGGIVCSIQDVGCPVDNCFCECSGSTCTYWSYWHLAGEQWSYSVLGADVYRVQDGDVEGWSWGEDDPPPVVPLSQICAPPATATPLPTATPTNTPLPPPSVNFWVAPQTVVAGECAALNWEVEHVRAVYLDGEGVGGHGTRSVCPDQSETYELRVVSASGESLHPVTLNVVQPSPTPTNTPTLPPAPTSTVAGQAQSTETATVAPTETSATGTASATETPMPSATPTPTMTASPTPVVPTGTATATATVTSTPTPRPVAQLLRASPTAASLPAVRPSPTPDDGLQAPGARGALSEETTNYALFGVLMAVLLGVGAVILIQRRR